MLNNELIAAIQDKGDYEQKKMLNNALEAALTREKKELALVDADKERHQLTMDADVEKMKVEKTNRLEIFKQLGPLVVWSFGILITGATIAGTVYIHGFWWSGK